MTCGTAIRTGFLAVALWAPAATASLAQSAPPQQPDLSADFSNLIDWIDSGLAQGAAASKPEVRTTPALGEGPVGQALDWLFSGGETDTPEAPEVSQTPKPAAPIAAATRSAAVTPTAETMEPPEGDPLNLEPRPRPVATVRPQGLLLPVAAP